MTLIDDDENIPGWKKSKYFLSKYPNIKIETGVDNTGNLFNVDNLWHCYTNYKNSMDFITADGGFDFSIDFNKQEVLSIKIIILPNLLCYSITEKGWYIYLKNF